MENLKNTQKNPQIIICPFLGFAEDVDTTLSYASHQNCCHHAKPVESVNIAYQHKYCLNPSFETCAIFSKEKIERLPKEIAVSKPRRKQTILIWIVAIVVVLLLLGIAGVAFRLIDIPGVTDPIVSIFSNITKMTNNSTDVIEIPVTSGSPRALEATSEIESVVTTKVLVTTTPTEMVKETITPMPTDIVPHALETPFGTNHQFVIHKLIEGEGLIVIAEKYKTTVDAIKAVNYQMSPTLIIGKLVIVPVNATEVTGLPSFSIYQVEESTIAISEVAAKLQVDAHELALYNDYSENIILKNGDLLIVPH